ncbi:MAG: lycopene beta-cyclase CrtY [Chakrabartia sp.]
MTKTITRCDIAIAGGGLSAGLIALALAKRHPDLDVRIVERAPILGGNHVWSFFSSDIAEEDQWIIAPFICHSWQGYDVAFPDFSRTLNETYNSIESKRFNEILKAALPADRLLVGEVVSLTPCQMILADGREVQARRVIDARGPGDLSTLSCGWQKFLGQALHIPGGHGLTRPIVKDATVTQIDGYRFVYCLPFDAETVFVEDTYYADTPDIDAVALRARIAAYADARGWRGAKVISEETGSLPVIMGGSFADYWRSTGSDIVKSGLRAGLCQPVTGYSLPDAVRLASLIAANPDVSDAELIDYAAQKWRERGYYRMLDKMLFRAARPERRYQVLQRFYALSEGLIRRFYAGQSTLWDKLRLLVGKPPVPIGRAIRAILEK